MHSAAGQQLFSSVFFFCFFFLAFFIFFLTHMRSAVGQQLELVDLYRMCSLTIECVLLL
jgi:hypothetical protein